MEQQDLVALFQATMNILTELHCGVPDALDRTGAAERLQQLAALWHCDESGVVEKVVDMAGDDADAYALSLLQKVAEALHMDVTPAELRKRWNESSESEKLGLMEGLASALEEIGR